MPNRVRLLLMLAVLAGTLIVAPPAGAAVTTSNVTTPADGAFLRFTGPTFQITVSGTSNGTTGDKVDLYCTRGTGTLFSAHPITTGLAVAADGSFTYTGTPGQAGDEGCVIRALPAGTTPTATTSLTAFTGPRVYLGEISDFRTASGAVYDYYIFNAQSQGGMDFDSLGSCGLDDSYVFDPASLARSQALFYCDAWFWYRDGDSANATRSLLQVDRRNAYVPGTAFYLYTGAGDKPGFLGITYTASFSPTTGDMTIEETNPVLLCPGNPFPVTATNCASFERAPVDIHRTVTMNRLGRVVSFSDTYTSRDGAAHAVDLLYEQDFRNSGNPAYRFPWREASYSQHTLNDAFAGPGGASPGSIFALAKIDAADGDLTSPRGAITYSSPPDAVRFLAFPTTPNAYWALRYRRTVPASGALRLAFVYSNASQQAEVNQFASQAEAALRTVAPSGGTSRPIRGGGAPQGGGGPKGGGGKGARNGFRGVSFGGRRLTVTRNRVKLRLACPKAATSACRGTATLFALASAKPKGKRRARPATYARKRFLIASGQRRRITLTLRRPARRALRANPRLAAVLAIAARAGAGQRQTTSANVRLTARRR